MKEQKEWIPFKDIEWDDVENNRFHIDTRDFHCGYFLKDELHPDWKTLVKYDHFFFTKEEVIKLVERLYEESGGKGGWRMLALVSGDHKVLNWNIKYIRIWRTEKGFLMCNSDNEAISKKVWSCKVEQEYLSHH